MAKNEIILGEYRCVYPALASAKTFGEQTEDQAKYSVRILIPKSDKEGVKKIYDFITAQVNTMNWKAPVKAQVLKVAEDNSDGYKDNAIVKDGDALNDKRAAEDKDPVDAYVGHYVVGMNRRASFGRPFLADENAVAIPELQLQEAFKGGYWIKVQASAYCYSQPKAGVTLQLGGAQFIRKDEVFGQSNPFEPVEIDDIEDDDIPL